MQIQSYTWDDEAADEQGNLPGGGSGESTEN